MGPATQVCSAKPLRNFHAEVLHRLRCVRYGDAQFRAVRRHPGGAPSARPRGEVGMPAGPTVRRRRLGTELRRLREAHALKLEEAAERLGLAPSTLSRIETGKAPTRSAYLTTMLEMYGVT